MYRSAPLLILLAFVLGLWIGFNPEARARAEATWQQADEAAVELGARVTASLDRLFNRVSEASPPPANPPIESKPSNFLGQVEAALAQLWEALVRLWESLVDRAASTT
jgi:sugar phosphate isomerase/epimerase